MSVRCLFLGAPENLGFLGRAEALVARRFSGAVSAMRLKCRMRVQNYCFFLTWQWVGPDCVRYWSGLRASTPMIGQSKKKVEKNTRSNRSTKKIVVVAYLQLSHVGIFVNCSQSSQSSHIFESQACVRI